MVSQYLLSLKLNRNEFNTLSVYGVFIRYMSAQNVISYTRSLSLVIDRTKYVKPMEPWELQLIEDDI